MCQLGGSNPQQLAQAARMVEQYGYDEINLNCGCPSDRVAGAGCFGAALMLQPETVAACAAAVNAATSIPLTIKCRLGRQVWQLLWSCRVAGENKAALCTALSCSFYLSTSNIGHALACRERQGYCFHMGPSLPSP